MNLSHCARTAAEMPNLYVSRRDHDLAITQRLHVLSVDAHTKWPWAAPVRRVKSSQPGHRTGVRFVLSVPAYSSTQVLGLIVRKTRRKPVSQFPHMSLEPKLFRVPTPLPNLLFRRKYSNKPKRHHSFEVRNTEHLTQ